MYVRRAVLDDAEAVGDAHAEAWRVGYSDLFPADQLALAVERRRGMWSHMMSAPWFSTTTLLVVQDGPDVVGFVQFGPAKEYTQMGEVYALYVHPRAWGSSAAPQLMAAAVSSLAQDGFRRLVLWTHAEAGPARSFYHKSGWTESGRQRDDQLGDGIWAPEVEYSREL